MCGCVLLPKNRPMGKQNIVIPFESMRGFYRLPWLVKVEEINASCTYKNPVQLLCVSLSTNCILDSLSSFFTAVKNIPHVFE